MGKHGILRLFLAVAFLVLGSLGLGAQTSEPVKLTWYIVGSWPQAGQEEVFAKFNTELIKRANIQIEIRALGWGDYDQKMKVLNASGEAYDIAFTAPWMNNYVQNVSKGALLPLDDLLKKYAPKTYASMAAKYWDAARIDGKIYGVMNQQIFARTSAMGGRKEFYDLAGVKLPQYPEFIADLKQLEPFLKALKAKLPANVTPLEIQWESLREHYGYEQLAPGVIVYFDDKNAKAKSEFDSKEFKAYYDLIRKWNVDGYLHGGEWVSVKDRAPAFKNGEIAFGVGGTYKPGGDVELEGQYGGMKAVSIPMSAPVATTSGIVATMFGIGRNSKHPVEAMQFLELLNTDKELYNLINFGIEGKHYTKVDANYIEGMKDSSYSPNILWELGTTFNAYLQKGQPADVWTQTKKLNESAKASPLVGFNFDGEPVKKEIAQVDAIWQQYGRLVNNGIGSDKEYREILDKVKKAGVDKIVAEADRQIAAWKSSKK